MAKGRKSIADGGTSEGGSNAAGGGAGAAAAGRLKPKRARTRKSVPRDRAAVPAPSQRTSVYRGVTRHRWTGRFEAHLWDKDTWSESQRKKKGRQVYLGAYGDEAAAARAYDLAALKYWGRDTVLNFQLSTYDEELREMEGQSREEYIGSLRRKSTGFSRGVSKYRGVARHHHNGKWEARIGRVLGNKYLYLGTYATQEEAAIAYDVAAIEHRGLNAVTNFDVSRYINWHRRRRSCSGAGDTEDAAAAATGIPGPHPTIDLDELMAAADAFDDDGQRSDLPADQLLPRGGPSTASAVGLLLQSPKFKEMIDQLPAASESRSTASPSSSSSSRSASPPLPAAPPDQQQPECNGGTSAARCSFPDDVQTYFGCEDDSFDFAEVDAFLFGDLGAYTAPMFHFELDV